MKKEIEKIDFKKLFIQNRTDIVFLLTAVLLGVFYDWTNMEIIIFAFFVGSILRPVSMKFFASIALFFLVLTPIVLSLKREDRAEEFAVYAYYFLVMAVIMGIYEMRNIKKNNQTEK